jgi:uncharacterized membrane protein YjgN (DUF898 family)
MLWQEGSIIYIFFTKFMVKLFSSNMYYPNLQVRMEYYNISKPPTSCVCRFAKKTLI